MSHVWGGAQWLLAIWLLLGLSVPLVVRVSGLNTKSPAAWLGWYAGRAFEIGVLTAVLLWGGFWP